MTVREDSINKESSSRVEGAAMEDMIAKAVELASWQRASGLFVARRRRSVAAEVERARGRVS